jgi:hypothetical protein
MSTEARFSSLVWVVGENHNQREVLELSSHQRLRQEGAFLSNYFAVTHPSGPNYRAMAAGRYWSHDERLDQQKPTFASEAGVPVTVWNFRGAPLRKHNPFYDLKTEHQAVALEELDLEQLPPRCVLYVGLDDDNNGHDKPAEVFDANINALLDLLTASSWFNTSVDGLYPALFVTWDEAYRARTNQVFAAFFGRGVKPGAESIQELNHFSFCRLCCESFGVSPLAHAAEAASIDGIWTSGS